MASDLLGAQRHRAGALMFVICVTVALATQADETVERVVQPGDTVTLPCGFPDDQEITWFSQRSDQMPVKLMVLELRRVGQVKPSPSYTKENYVGRLSPGCNSTGTHCVQLRNVTEADLMLYYCTKKKLIFGNGTRLVFPDVTENDKAEPIGPTIDFPQHHSTSGTILPWVLLPCVGLLSAVVSCICCFFYNRAGAVRSFDDRLQIRGEHSRQEQEKEVDIQYSSVTSKPPEIQRGEYTVTVYARVK